MDNAKREISIFLIGEWDYPPLNQTIDLQDPKDKTEVDMD